MVNISCIVSRSCVVTSNVEYKFLNLWLTLSTIYNNLLHSYVCNTMYVDYQVINSQSVKFSSSSLHLYETNGSPSDENVSVVLLLLRLCLTLPLI